MTAHHLIRETEMAIQCPYCGEQLDLDKWRSTHYLNKHYKANTCGGCNKKICVTVDFCGSGHDTWKHNIAKKATEHNLETKVNGK